MRYTFNQQCIVLQNFVEDLTRRLVKTIQGKTDAEAKKHMKRTFFWF